MGRGLVYNSPAMQDDRDPRGHSVTLPAQPGEAGTPEDSPEPACLMIIEAGSSALMELPASGELASGRAPEVQVRLQDPSVSRFHARLLLQEGNTTSPSPNY